MIGFLGMDTSCYTTSVAAVDSQGNIIAAERRLLLVPEGGRGLRQQEMVFQHVANLPELFTTLMAQLPKDMTIAACAASTRPRDVQGSYMPAFTVGEGFAKVLRAGLQIPFYATDHQRGHIEAVRHNNELVQDDFLAMHLSGGTTELLQVSGGKVSCLGGTTDISFGQLVDRTGVALGLPFPAGPNLEKLAVSALEGGMEVPTLPGVSVKGMDCSVSGAEAHMMRSEEESGHKALAVYSFIVRSMSRLIKAGAEHSGISTVLLFGGVASSQLLRDMLPKRLQKDGVKASIVFGQRELSADNAVGVARVAMMQYKGE